MCRRPSPLARERNPNPWVPVTVSAGHGSESLISLPWFQTDVWQLAPLALLRVASLVVPAYVVIRGREIATVFNISVAALFVVNTSWWLCHFVYV